MRNLKNLIIKLNLQIKELMGNLNIDDHIEFEEDNEILLDIEDCEYDIEDLEKLGIYEFDDFLSSLRENMISSMINIGQAKK